MDRVEAATIGDALRELEPIAVTDRWRVNCQLEPTLAAGPVVDVDRELAATVCGALQVDRALDSPRDELVSEATREFLGGSPSALLAFRMLIVLGHAVQEMLPPSTGAVTRALAQRLHLVLAGASLEVLSRAMGELDRLAYRDGLTGLWNRRAFNRDSGNALFGPHAASVLVAALDLDDLKKVNDSEGHQAGDVLLGRMASSLSESLFEGQTAYRYGGDEFAILSIQQPADRLRTSLMQLQTGEPRFSWGLSTTQDGSTTQELWDSADGRMYEDKERRKGSSGWRHRLRTMLPSRNR